MRLEKKLRIPHNEYEPIVKWFRQNFSPILRKREFGKWWENSKDGYEMLNVGQKTITEDPDNLIFN